MDALTIWLRLQALLWAPALVVVAVVGRERTMAWLPAVAAAAAVGYVALMAILRAGRTVADVVTIARALGLFVLIALDPTLAPWRTWMLTALLASCDLLDGALARRFGSTPGGAVLDMETDQFTVLTFSLLAIAYGLALHVLLLPLMRYAFVLAAWCCRVPAHDPKPVDGDNSRGRLICAAVVIGLLVALLPCVPHWLANVATGLAVMLLLWSFSSDWAFLASHRAMARARG